MPVTPRRSTRGTVFSPITPSSVTSFVQPNTTFTWTSGPIHASSSTSLTQAGPSSSPIQVHGQEEEVSERTYYTSFLRTVNHSGLTPKKGRKTRKDEEAPFKIGDGVVVSVEGGSDGLAVLTRLWEEPEPKDEDDSDDSDDEVDEEGKSGGSSDSSEERGTRMMGEVHWCFRRKDLPGIMKDLRVQEVGLTQSMTSSSSLSGSCLADARRSE